MDYKEFFDKDNSGQWHIACLNFAHDGWDLYATGYKNAADVLIQSLSGDQTTKNRVDTLVYPILFLYRQYLELRFKQLILKISGFLGQPERVKLTHKIDSLWGILKPLMEDALREAGDQGDTAQLFTDIEECVKRYSELDPTSTAFRYPVDNNSNPSIPSVQHISVGELSYVVNSISSALDGASTQIDVWNDYLGDAYAANVDEWMLGGDDPTNTADNGDISF